VSLASVPVKWPLDAAVVTLACAVPVKASAAVTASAHVPPLTFSDLMATSLWSADGNPPTCPFTGSQLDGGCLSF
jgi:hypothetical protein